MQFGGCIWLLLISEAQKSVRCVVCMFHSLILIPLSPATATLGGKHFLFQMAADLPPVTRDLAAAARVLKGLAQSDGFGMALLLMSDQVRWRSHSRGGGAERGSVQLLQPLLRSRDMHFFQWFLGHASVFATFSPPLTPFLIWRRYFIFLRTRPTSAPPPQSSRRVPSTPPPRQKSAPPTLCDNSSHA